MPNRNLPALTTVDIININQQLTAVFLILSVDSHSLKWCKSGYMVVDGILATWWLHENGGERWQDQRRQTRQT